MANVPISALRKAILGALTGEAAPAGRILAYHGTPHTLAPEPGAPLGRFKLEHVGTGEGAQAYGWGVPYLAEDAGTAGWYRDKLGQQALYDRGLSGPEEAAARAILNNDRDIGRARESMQRLVRHFEERGYTDRTPELKSYRGALRILDDPNYSPPLGRMYEVDIPEGPYLDYDIPIGEQGSEVLEAIGRLPRAQLHGQRWLEPQMRLPGSSLAPRTREGARHLSDAGIPGIQYLDGTSRGAGEGTRNYVMFDPDQVSIRALRAALLAALVGGGAANAYQEA